jgi:hypothetical protein
VVVSAPPALVDGPIAVVPASVVPLAPAPLLVGLAAVVLLPVVLTSAPSVVLVAALDPSLVVPMPTVSPAPDPPLLPLVFGSSDEQANSSST